MTDSARLTHMEDKLDKLATSVSETKHSMNNMQDQINAILRSQERIETIMMGDGTKLNPGLIERYLVTEKFIEWVKSKKTWILGFIAAFTLLWAFIYGVSEILIKIKELKGITK